MMKKIALFLFFLLFIVACNNEKKENNAIDTDMTSASDGLTPYEREKQERLTIHLKELELGKIDEISIFRDTFFDVNYKYQTVKYKKYDSIEEAKQNFNELHKYIYLFPPGFRYKFRNNLDTLVILKKLLLRNNYTTKEDTILGVFKKFIHISKMEVYPHEVLHLMDNVLNKEDEKWGRAVYGEYYKEFYKDYDENYSGRPLGFITNYAKYSMQEDRAETLLDMMLYQKWKLHLEDKFLMKKVERMKKELFELDTAFNEQYWKDIEAGKVNKDYWKNRQKTINHARN